ncbi:MAG: hypothetical protein RR092_02000 [Oscillospiraceae bacterium]
MGLMDDKYTYSKLVGDYGQFRAPAIKLKVDGSPLSGAVAVERVSATLSLDSASAVTFQVTGAYDVKSGGFQSSVKSKLKLGAKVSLSLGYGSATTEIFQGFISGVGAQFRDAPELSVTAMDVRRFMMEGTSREEMHVVSTYSAAFEEVMKRYSALCPSLEVDATDSDEITQIFQRASDYEFVVNNLAKKTNREFFVLADKAYFRKRAKVTAPLMTLRWGEGMLSFSRNSLYQNVKIVVLGFDPDKQEAVKAEVAEKASDAQKNAGSQNETVIADPDAKEEAKAKKRAEKEAAERKRKAQNGSVDCVGLPEIVPGRFITLTGLDSDLDNDYYIREVRHEFGSDGFTTSFEIGGWDA